MLFIYLKKYIYIFKNLYNKKVYMYTNNIFYMYIYLLLLIKYIIKMYIEYGLLNKENIFLIYFYGTISN